jgi:hypothetical protein
MKIHNYTREFEHHNHEIAGGNGKMYGYEITQK